MKQDDNMSNRGSLNEDDSVSSSSSIPNLAEKLVLDENAPRARLCHLKKWPHFQGYGFNLHAECSRIGQHIGKVDPNSPAESAGLKEGDRIIEVNYVNISNENHQQVVKRIRTGLEVDGDLHEDEVVLLVVDSEADEYYKKLNIVVKHDFANVIKLATSTSLREGESSQPAIGDTDEVNEKEQVQEQQNQQQHQTEEPKRLVNHENPSNSKLDRNDLANGSMSSTNYYETNSLSDASDSNINSKPKEKHLSNSKQITSPSPVNSETDSNNNSLINEKQRSSYDKQQQQQQSQPSPSNSNKLNSSPSSLSSASKDSSNVSNNQNKMSTNKKSPPELKDDPFSKFHFLILFDFIFFTFRFLTTNKQTTLQKYLT
jgi:hypothetical protein